MYIVQKRSSIQSVWLELSIPQHSCRLCYGRSHPWLCPVPPSLFQRQVPMPSRLQALLSVIAICENVLKAEVHFSVPLTILINISNRFLAKIWGTPFKKRKQNERKLGTIGRLQLLYKKVCKTPSIFTSGEWLVAKKGNMGYYAEVFFNSSALLQLLWVCMQIFVIFNDRSSFISW